jgi:hypothetical protein
LEVANQIENHQIHNLTGKESWISFPPIAATWTGRDDAEKKLLSTTPNVIFGPVASILARLKHRHCATPLRAVAKGAVCPFQQLQRGGLTEAQIQENRHPSFVFFILARLVIARLIVGRGSKSI